MNSYELCQKLMIAGCDDEIVITDGTKQYSLDNIHVNSGIVKILIKEERDLYLERERVLNMN